MGGAVASVVWPWCVFMAAVLQRGGRLWGRGHNQLACRSLVLCAQTHSDPTRVPCFAEQRCVGYGHLICLACAHGIHALTPCCCARAQNTDHATAPQCSGTPNPGNSQRDASGKYWGFENGEQGVEHTGKGHW